ncbi:hypothetical protein [Pedobacter nyackensis]|uniref:Lipocalin-like domain-containing protein n=1 Tax=Pedobacter nyackensis TaxID=475255 RepID=A0A1W2AHT9_9SPHI|nr:hypothetical protein [Pedobacter nyackensis]SMC60289.1 hypothetical protein SAMN04488101_101632 [Pedobacter nyackensis]
MKTMNLINRAVSFTMVLALMAAVFTGCSKNDDDDQGGSEDKGIVKMTVTTSGEFDKNKGADINLTVSSHDSRANYQKWKVNGVETGAEMNHTYLSDAFNGGKTLVLESPQTYLGASVNLSASTSDVGYTLSYKLEEKGKVVEEATIVVAKDKPVRKNWVFSNYGK